MLKAYHLGPKLDDYFGPLRQQIMDEAQPLIKKFLLGYHPRKRALKTLKEKKKEEETLKKRYGRNWKKYVKK